MGGLGARYFRASRLLQPVGVRFGRRRRNDRSTALKVKFQRHEMPAFEPAFLYVTIARTCSARSCTHRKLALIEFWRTSCLKT